MFLTPVCRSCGKYIIERYDCALRTGRSTWVHLSCARTARYQKNLLRRKALLEKRKAGAVEGSIREQRLIYKIAEIEYLQREIAKK